MAKLTRDRKATVTKFLDKVVRTLNNQVTKQQREEIEVSLREWLKVWKENQNKQAVNHSHEIRKLNNRIAQLEGRSIKQFIMDDVDESKAGVGDGD